MDRLKVLIIVGRSTSQEYLEKLLRRLRSCPFGDHLLVSSFSDDLVRVLAEPRILGLPSVDEELPNAVLGAMAMECPVVATNEAVKDGMTRHLMSIPISDDLLLGRLRFLY